MKGGLNYGREISNKSGNSKFTTSFQLGMFTSLKAYNRVTITGEYVLSDKGAEIFERMYLAIPVMAEYALTERFTVYTGPGINILLVPIDQEKRPSTNWLDLGALAGIKYKIQPRMAIGLRFEQGISNTIGRNAKLGQAVGGGFDPAYNDPETVRDLGYRSRNQYLELSVFYTITRPKQ